METLFFLIDCYTMSRILKKSVFPKLHIWKPPKYSVRKHREGWGDSTVGRTLVFPHWRKRDALQKVFRDAWVPQPCFTEHCLLTDTRTNPAKPTSGTGHVTEYSSAVEYITLTLVFQSRFIPNNGDRVELEEKQLEWVHSGKFYKVVLLCTNFGSHGDPMRHYNGLW